MASELPLRPILKNSAQLSSKPIAIVASKFNKAHVDGLIDSCVEELKEILPEALIHIVRVPGSYEIPVTVQHLANQGTTFGCFIALGVVLQGSTAHGNHVSSSVSDALMEISVRLSTPVISEVLHVNNMEQADERCFGVELNRGVEAARTAAAMLSLFEEIAG